VGQIQSSAWKAWDSDIKEYDKMASLGWGDAPDSIAKLDDHTLKLLNNYVEKRNEQRAYKPQAVPPPPPQQGFLGNVGQSLGAIVGGSIGGSTSTWTDYATTSTTTADTNALAFQQLYDMSSGVREQGRASVGPITRGPYLNRLRDEVDRWHGDPLER
jgi:hypothetical protein